MHVLMPINVIGRPTDCFDEAGNLRCGLGFQRVVAHPPQGACDECLAERQKRTRTRRSIVGDQRPERCRQGEVQSHGDA